MAAQKFDIVIIGGGMVGACLANLLANTSYQVALVDAQQPTPFDDSHTDLRVSALSLASQRIFDAIGAWDWIDAKRYSPYNAMHVWDATGDGAIHFSGPDAGVAELGYIVENSLATEALWRRLQRQRNITLFCPTTVESMTRDINAIDGCVTTLQLDNGTTLSCDLLVGADGQQSQIRQLAGIETLGWTYPQKGVVAVVKTAKPHQATAWQRFLPTGPLAFLPLSDGSCSIVWSTVTEEADRLLSLDDAGFASALHQASGGALGDIEVCSQRAAFPLSLMHAKQYTLPGLALVGDAAHVVHPLAGQGVNLGLLDAAVLAEQLEQGINYRALRRYERTRKAENSKMLAATEGFHRLFDNTTEPLRIIRNMGLNIMNELSPVKHDIMRLATGLKGDLPSIAKDV